jgi:uncharacterized protein (DUF2141 family)
MIKAKILLTLTVVLTLFASCTKNDIDDVVLKRGGSFVATITDSEANPYSSKKVQLLFDGQLIKEVTTDESGVADFSKVNEGNYTLQGNDFEESGLKYSFSRTIQVVTDEKNEVTIIPSEFSGKMTIGLFEKHQVDDQGNSDFAKQNGGTLALLNPRKVAFYDFESLKNSLIVEKQLPSDDNQVSFERLPVGSYYLMYYTDETHYEVLSGRNYDLSQHYSDVFTVEKDADYNIELSVRGGIFNDYSGDISISVFEYFQFEYSSQSNPEALTSGKVALIRDIYYNASFDDLKSNIYVEKELDGKSNKVTFNDVKAGTYSVMIYTDESHYQVAKLGYFRNSDNTIFLGPEKLVEEDAFVNATEVREILIDQKFYCYEYVYDPDYKKEACQGFSIYILENGVYDNLEYSFRSVKSIIEKFAMKSGVTDENGLLTLSIDGYKQLRVVAFDKNGKFVNSIDLFVTESSGLFSFRLD